MLRRRSCGVLFRNLLQAARSCDVRGTTVVLKGSGSRCISDSTAQGQKSAAALQSARRLPNKLFIDGAFVDSASGRTFETIDPRTEEVITQVAEGDSVDVDRAVQAARKAFDQGPWRKMTATQRGRLMYKLADLIEANADELAALETLDNGKPVAVARAADIPLTAGHIRYFAGWADKQHGKVIQADGPYKAYTYHEPLGVVGKVTPWNFPLLMVAWAMGPALAAGNTMVVKVAEQTPLTAVRLAELVAEAGFPDGVVNIVTGYGETAGAALAGHPSIDKISFTGSTQVGRLIYQAAAENLIPCTLELGGKNPLIIWKDVDVAKAVEDAHFGLFFNHGQCCAAGSRTYVHRAIYDEFVERAAERAHKRTVGDPFTDVEQGPQVDKDQFNKIMSYIDRGQQEGARLVAGGKRVGSKGYYVEPTVFADAKEGMSIAAEEIFGPVQTIIPYDRLDEVIQRANTNNYGLAAGVFARDIDVVNTMSRALQAGTIWVNTYNVYDHAVPFGGYKESGVGRDKGQYALDNYTQIKAVYEKMEDPVWL